jgi:hypothetical protein
MYSLPPEHVAELDKLSQPVLPFPSAFLAQTGDFMYPGLTVNGDTGAPSPMIPKNASERY